MELINIGKLDKDRNSIKDEFQSQTPFHYVVIENFLHADKAKLVHDAYPSIKDGKWDGTTYINQKNKFQKTKFDKGSIFETVFKELNSEEFLHWLEDITGIDDLIADDELFGGGLHQSVAGAFLNVHVDYNLHPTTRFHRRLNVLVYMNKDWKEEYE